MPPLRARIHVAYVVIDGGINGRRPLSRAPDLLKQRGEDGLLSTDAIAEPISRTA